MDVSNKIIQSFWYGDQLTQIEQLSIKSFLANGHEFHLYTYNPDLLGVPKECIIKDASAIIPSSKVFFDNRGIIASFSDYFRIQLLYKKGGWWVDLDIVCLHPFDFDTDYCFSSEYVQNKPFPNIGCIKCPRHSDFLDDYLRVIEKYLSSYKVVNWGVFGPKLMHDLLQQYDSSDYVQPPETFIMPRILYSKSLTLVFDNLFKEFTRDAIISGLEESHSVHLYNELWRLLGIDKTKKFPKNSLLEYLNQLYL
ncbi:glycosyltransferase [Sphingobacterium thalpophilum]|uniref:glycosyltransferase n=1 Tax=Sphingobacterium thalpophilum TaxID=259 RepID=UPI003C7166FA